MKMRLVQMRCNDDFVAFAQKPVCKLYADRVSFVGSSFPRRKGLDDMIPFPLAVLFAPPLLCCQHILVGPCLVAVDRAFITGPFRLGPIHRIVNSGLQRGLFLVLHIVYTLVQPIADNEDFGVGH